MFNKKNKFRRFFVPFLFSFILVIVGLSFSSVVLAGDTFGANIVGNSINLSDKDPRTIVSQIINIALGFLGIVAVGIVIYGGFVWMTAEGSEDKVDKAKKILKAGVIGLLIILASWGIAAFVLNKLGGATGTAGLSCTDGEVRDCGCDGLSTCSGGSWGSCVGSICVEGGEGSSCSSALAGVCQPDNTICRAGLECDTNCKCAWPGEGEPCGEIDSATNTCTPNNDDCSNPSLTCANNCTCQAEDENYSELGDPCYDGGSCSATEDVCNPNHGLTCSASTCTCVGNPVITAISPVGGFCVNAISTPCQEDSQCPGSTCDKTTPNFAKGNFITILGYNFDTYNPGNTNPSIVEISKTDPYYLVRGQNPTILNSSCVDTWTNNKIIIAIPTSTAFAIGSEKVELKVHTRTNKADTTRNDVGPLLPYIVVNNISRPGLCGISDNEAQANEDVFYYGTSLNSGRVYFGNSLENVLAFEPNTLGNDSFGVAKVPTLSEGTVSTFVQKVSTNNVKISSNFLDFTKLAEPIQGPSISYFGPTSGPAGQYVTIVGSGFNASKGESVVTFKGSEKKEASYSFPLVCAHSVWTDNQIIVKVPEGIVDGDYDVVVKIGNWPDVVAEGAFTASSSMSLQPGLCKISPISGPEDSQVSLFGEYFGESALAIFNSEKNTNVSTTTREELADKLSVNVPTNSITGPVKVSRAGIFGNSLNFTVGSCSANSDCSTGHCCLPGTPLVGACVNNRSECFADTPNSSVFQWGFTTGFATTTPTTPPGTVFSCASYSFCPTTNWKCPNTPGLCSPYNASGQLIATGDCKYNCGDFSFCDGNKCDYDSDIDKCFIKNYTCSISKNVKYNLGYGDIETIATCQAHKTSDGSKNYYTITTNTTCPTGWSMVPNTNNTCVDVSPFGIASTCSLCSTGGDCQLDKDTTSTDPATMGICASGKLCSDNSICYNDNKCKKADASSCDCCCEKDKNITGGGNPACCAPLSCGNTCGADSNNTAGNLGLCSGCYGAGNTTASRDLACNCATVSGQYCDNSKYSDGVCLDCTALGETSCKEHSAACCWDPRANNNAGACHGGKSDASVWGGTSLSIGLCPYYNCDSSNVSMCASLTPTTTGAYPDIPTCTDGCAKNCDQYTTKNTCNSSSSCCWDNANGGSCLGGDKFTSGADNGLCKYYSCTAPATGDCTASTTGAFLKENACETSCKNTSTGFNTPCFDYLNPTTCLFTKCNLSNCIKKDGNTGDVSGAPESCGTCCCDPNASVDKCKTTINPNLTCVADKGSCSGSSRGLCCGCESDKECSPETGLPTEVGCGFDTCCQARPKINSDLTKVAALDVYPEHRSTNVCRNALIEINFDQRLDALTLEENILLLEESATSTCSDGTYQVSLISNDIVENNNIFAKIKNIFVKTINYVARLTGKSAIAAPIATKTYCAVLGTVDFDHNTDEQNRTSVYFKPKNLLKPSTKYFVVVKGDEKLDSTTGIKAHSGVGMNGTGYFEGSAWIESNASTSIKFNTVYYENSYIWDFTTLSVNTANSGICVVDNVKVSPGSYLFNTNKNDINENDTDPNHKSFNSVKDSDTLFTAQAYSSDKQLLNPSSDYNWVWNWQISNNAKLAFKTVSSLPANGSKRLIQVKDGIVDGEADVKASVVVQPGSVTTAGNNANGSAKAYILICKNPWPAFRTDGTWIPWMDTSSFNNYNYKFYYCRDSAGAGGDLPAFLNDLAIVRGNSLVRVCSNVPSQTCSTSAPCPSGGICLASFLKETYFFRNIVERFVENVSITDPGAGDTLEISWESLKEAVSGYKVYYKKTDSQTWLEKSVPLSSCSTQGDKYICETKLDGLAAGQNYEAKVTAISGSGETNFSLTVTGSPSEIFSCGGNLNYDGYDYKTVKIGEQCWLAENLRTIVGASVCYANKPENCDTYGRLYTWNDAIKGGTANNKIPSGVQGICPVGWHIPSQFEWKNLNTYISSRADYICNGKDTYTAKALASRSLWKTDPTDCTVGKDFDKNNKSEFNALPGGLHSSPSSGVGISAAAYFWSTTSMGSSIYFAGLGSNSQFLNFSSGINPNYMVSVRCLEDY